MAQTVTATKKMLFHNSVNGDRVYTSEDFANFYSAGLFDGDGIIKGFSDALKVIPSGGLIVEVEAGVAIIGGRKTQAEGSAVLLDINPSAVNRTDYIVLREDNTSEQRLVQYAVLQGTSDGSATPPTITYETADAGIRELKLATINMTNSVSTITTGEIQDNRFYVKFREDVLPTLVKAFTDLSDTFSSFSGLGLRGIRINAGETQLESFIPDNNTNTGIQTGLILVANGTTQFDIGAGTYLIVDNSNPAIPVTKRITFGGQTAITVPDIAARQITHVGINEAGTIIQQAVLFTTAQRRTIVTLGILAHFDNVNITDVLNTGILAARQPLLTALDLIGDDEKNISGNKITPNSGANLSIDVSSGVFAGMGLNRLADENDPNRISFAGDIVAPFRYMYRDGVGGLAFGATTVTVLDPDKEDNGTGTPASIGGAPTQATNQWVFRSPRTGNLFVAYGQTVHVDLATGNLQKRTGLDTLAGFSADVMQDLVLVSIITVITGASDLTDSAEADFADVLGGSTGGTSGGGLISTLNDTDIVNTSILNDLNGLSNQKLVNEMLENKATTATSRQGTGTITTTGWGASGSDYGFELSLAIAGVLATDTVFISIDKDGQDIAGDAELSPSNDAYAGGVIFYANVVPAATIAFSYVAFKVVA